MKNIKKIRYYLYHNGTVLISSYSQIDIINNNSDDPELDVDYFKEEDKTEIKESDIDIDSSRKNACEIKPF